MACVILCQLPKFRQEIFLLQQVIDRRYIVYGLIAIRFLIHFEAAQKMDTSLWATVPSCMVAASLILAVFKAHCNKIQLWFWQSPSLSHQPPRGIYSWLSTNPVAGIIVLCVVNTCSYLGICQPYSYKRLCPEHTPSILQQFQKVEDQPSRQLSPNPYISGQLIQNWLSKGIL